MRNLQPLTWRRRFGGYGGSPISTFNRCQHRLDFDRNAALLLDLSDRIRDLILDRRPTSEIKKAAREEGMRFLRDSAVEQVLLGRTTLREINKVTFVE